MGDILILANSVKNRGFCVAGKDVVSNRWLRLVGDKGGAEIYLEQTAFKDLRGKTQKIPYEPFNRFIRIDTGKAVPLIYQPENILVKQGLWEEVNIKENNIYYDIPDDLWGEGDRIKAEDINQGKIKIEQSLYLIEVKK